MGEVLTMRQQQILRFISNFLSEKGYPPSVREIGEAVGLNSSSSVHSQLKSLQKRGYLRRDPTKPRTIEVRWDPASGARAERARVRNVPLLGQVAAGYPVLAAEQVQEVFPLPQEFVGEGTVFMLRIKGDSMEKAGIFDGDYVLIRKQLDAEDGEIVAVLVDDEEATVKRIRRSDGRVQLIPENDAYSPMSFDERDVSIIGKVVSVIRTNVS